MTDKRADTYSETFTSYEGLLSEVNEMEENSAWIGNVPTETITMEAVYPIEASRVAGMYGLDPTLTMETANPADGTNLILIGGGRAYLVRDTAIPTIQEAAKLSGSALGRMNPNAYSSVLNEGFTVARGCSLFLERYGKLSACHSGSGSGYEIMPISDLLEATRAEAEKRFGEIEFKQGYNSHAFTEAWWTLPAAQSKLVDKYQRALDEAGVVSNYAINFMPALHFFSSDTANSCATLTPVFIMPGNRAIQLVDGIKVKHTKKGEGKMGTELYREEIGEIYSRFGDFPAAVIRLAGIEIRHPENCVISLCKRYAISKKYGEAAREEVCRCCGGGGRMNAHDLVVAMTATVAAAKMYGASRLTVNNIEEAVAKMAYLPDFGEHDVGGTVSW